LRLEWLEVRRVLTGLSVEDDFTFGELTHLRVALEPGRQLTGPLDISIQPTVIPIGRDASVVETADFDGDGWLDFAVNDSHAAVTLFRNDGAGLPFSPAIIPLPSRASDLVAADFNQDGAIDLAVGYNFLPHVSADKLFRRWF
jgi:hypothetical protein